MKCMKMFQAVGMVVETFRSQNKTFYLTTNLNRRMEIGTRKLAGLVSGISAVVVVICEVVHSI